MNDIRLSDRYICKNVKLTQNVYIRKYIVREWNVYSIFETMNVNLIVTSLFDKPEKSKHAFINSSKKLTQRVGF